MEAITEKEAVAVFAKNLSELRQSRQLSQADLAEAVGLSRGIVGYYEACSKNPTLRSICRFAEFFDVPVSYFLEDHNDKGRQSTRPTSRLQQQVERIRRQSPAKKRLISDIIEAALNSA